MHWQFFIVVGHSSLNHAYYLTAWNIILSLQVGVMIAARRYDLNSAAPFQSTDILDLQPVVKHSVPISSEAKDLIETGKIQLAEVCTWHLGFTQNFLIFQLLETTLLCKRFRSIAVQI